MAPLTAYLDSSDYSTLSDPKRLTEELGRTRVALLALARSGQVRFAFSGTHLSEIAPAQARFTPSAAGRADLLSDLCGRTALLSFDRMLAQEIERLADDGAPPVDAISTDGNWFPELGDLFEDAIDLAGGLREALQTELKALGSNQRQQRILMKQLFPRGKPGPLLQQIVRQAGAKADLNEILRRYPMRPQDMRILWEFVAGSASSAQAQNALLESLRDPRWMMRWFEEHHEKLGFIYDWFRAPALQLITTLEGFVSRGTTLLTAMSPEDRTRYESVGWWDSLEDNSVLATANHLLAKRSPPVSPCSEVRHVDERCPGLSTIIRTTHACLRDAFGPTPRALKPSDFVDAVHAMYAPYVDVFRADRYMAGHVSRLTKRWGTSVVGRLEELPDALQQVLAQR